MNTNKMPFTSTPDDSMRMAAWRAARHAEIALDTSLGGAPETFNPAELLLAALSACMQRGKNLLIRQVSGRAKEHN